MKSNLLRILFAVFLFIFFNNIDEGFSQEPIVKLSPQELAWLKTHPSIKLGFNPNMEPLVIANKDGTYSGTLIALFDELGDITGIDFEIEIDKWPKIIEKARHKEIDVLMASSPQLARSLGMRQTVPIYNSFISVYARKDRNFSVNKLEDLKGLKVALLKGAKLTAEVLAPVREHCTVFEMDSNIEAFNMTHQGKTDLTLATNHDAYLLRKYMFADIEAIHSFRYLQVESASAVRGDWPELVSILNKGLHAIGMDKVRNIISKWTEFKGIITLTPKEQAWLEAHPSIKLGWSDDEPWVIVSRDGTRSGALIEIFDELGDVIGIDFEIEIDRWPKIIEKVRRGEIDGLMGCSPSLARSLKLHQTLSYYNTFISVYARKDRRFSVNELEDLKGLKVAFVKGAKLASDILDPIREYCTVFETGSVAEAFSMTHHGKADVTLAPNHEIYILKKYLLADIEVIYSFMDLQIEAAAGVRADWPEVVSIINKGFDAIGMGNVRNIMAKWFEFPSTEQSLELTQEEKSWLAKHRKLRLGSLEDWPPFEFAADDNAFAGVMADLIGQINIHLDLSMKPELGLTHSEMIAKAKLKELDVITSVVRTPERERDFIFTEPHTSLPQVLITHEGFRFISKIENLGQARFAVVRDSITGIWLKRDYPNLTLIEYDSLAQALEAVSRQEADVVMAAQAVAEYIQRKQSIKNLRVAAITPYEVKWCMAVRNDWPKLADILNKQLAAISEREKSLMLEKWMRFRVERQVDWRLMLFYGLGLICVAGAIITIFFYANRKLAAEVLQRKKAERSATAANRAKSVFLANMSHELRTPLNAILGYGQLLGQDPDISGKYRKNIGTINRSATHLLRMIDEILEISKIESGRIMLNKKVFNLPSLVNTTLAMVRMRADQKGLNLAATVAADVPDLIFADEDKLHQILSNLLGNSIKYTEKGRIELKVDVTGDGDRHPDRLILQVTDTGLGIAPEHIEKIFEPFFQKSDHTRSTDGTGLGLALVKQYVTAMEGTISVNSILGQGTTFQIDLPYEPARETEIEERPPNSQIIGLAANQPRYRILIVEDNPDSRTLLHQMLEPVGFSIKTAANGREAVDVHAKWRPHLIWMDIRMPVMNGLEATRCIRELETGVDRTDGFEKTTIIALTASVFEDAREEIMASGFDDFMRKPFTVAELFECMARHLNIQYIYRISRDTDTMAKTTEGDMGLTADDLKGLSTEWLENMRQAVLRGRSRPMLSLIEEIRQSHSRLADALTKLVKDFRIEEIPVLLNRQ